MSKYSIASDGKPIEMATTPAGLSEKSGVSLSVAQPLMKRDLERAGKTIYVLPKWRLEYDEEGYCVLRATCDIPYKIAAELDKLNK